MMGRMKRLLALFGFALALIVPVGAQDAAHDLLLRTNNLRGELGRHTYRWNAQLAAAAQTHANWLANTSRDCNRSDCHRDDAGNLARDRARIAGYPGERVHENVYAGGDPSANSAWRFWSTSDDHYRNLISPNNSEIGIGSATGARGTTYFVQVFGHNSGGPRTGSTSNAGGSEAGQSAPAGPPSYVLGLDKFGNIRHEVQPGQTIGHILLIYGYTWDEYPYLLEINGMSEADRLNMQPGSVILVPPKDGTFTPAPAEAQPTETGTAVPTVEPTSAPAEATSTSTAEARPTLAIRIAPAAATAAPTQMRGITKGTEPSSTMAELILLSLAIIVQLGILGGASVALISRSR